MVVLQIIVRPCKRPHCNAGFAILYSKVLRDELQRSALTGHAEFKTGGITTFGDGGSIVFGTRVFADVYGFPCFNIYFSPK